MAEPGGPRRLRPRDGRDGDFHLSRVVIAFVLTGIVAFQAARDAIDPTYSLDLQTLIALLVAILGLVGLEARDIMRRGDD